MDLSKMRGTSNKGKKDSSQKKSDNSKRGLPDVAENNPASEGSRGPKNITETKPFKQGLAGIGQMWGNYKAVLGQNFSQMSRSEQEMLITRLCQVVTVGFAIVLTNFFYQFIPLLIRVFAFPAIIVGSWFVATKVVAPIVISQYEHKLNKD